MRRRAQEKGRGMTLENIAGGKAEKHADPGAGCQLWPGEQVNKSKSLSQGNTTGANRSWQARDRKAWLRNTDSTKITTMNSECGATYFSPQGTSRSLDHRVGPVGIHHIVEECRVLLKQGANCRSSQQGCRETTCQFFGPCATHCSLKEQRHEQHSLEVNGIYKRLRTACKKIRHLTHTGHSESTV